MEKENIILIILIGIMIIGSASAGWFINELFNELYKSDVEEYKKYDGLRFVYNNSHPLAIEKAQSYDEYGDWVCFNVSKCERETPQLFRGGMRANQNKAKVYI